MKSLFISLAFLLVWVNSYSQEKKPPEHSSDYYLTKSKKQKKIGNILLFTSMASIITGVAYPRGKANEDYFCFYTCNDRYENSSIKRGFILAGIVLSIPSFTFYINSYTNGEKAETALSLHFENRGNQLQPMPGGPQPTLSLRLAL